MTRRFVLVRYADPSGVSGVGIVAEGSAFTDGTVALQWRGSAPAISIWPDVEAMIEVHGHGGRTVIHWIDDDRGNAHHAAQHRDRDLAGSLR
ncbi:MAG: hypothetical protein L0K86_06440 [Actinomycetia bacterium]|nr:hypothetical protein [Actinomycetes bacterium]